MSDNGKVKKFHQFIKIEKGPVNTAVIDLLKGQVYQVENSIVNAFENHQYGDISDFLESADEAGLIIDIAEGDWIPSCGEIQEREVLDFKEKVYEIVLHVEEGVNLEVVLDKFKYHNLIKVVFYGPEIPQIATDVNIEKRQKSFQKCSQRICMDGDLEPVSEYIYKFNRLYNSCWGQSVAITKDGRVRPCIHSNIVIGHMLEEGIDEILEKLQAYWHITKDKVEKCKICELRHVCFDCREIPYRENGDLYAANPACKYDPYKGTWA